VPRGLTRNGQQWHAVFHLKITDMPERIGWEGDAGVL